MVVDPIIELRLAHASFLGLQRQTTMFVAVLVTIVYVALNGPLGVWIDVLPICCLRCGVPNCLLRGLAESRAFKRQRFLQAFFLLGICDLFVDPSLLFF